MNLRLVLALVALSPAMPAAAGEFLKPQQAHHFVAGKYFAYTCFEGTSGSGRIQADGSVAGTIRIKGQGPARFVKLPAGTIKVKPSSICASVRGIPMEPCFNVEQLDANSFRGSVAGLGFAHCTFTRRNPRFQLAEVSEDALPRTTGSIRRSRAVKSAEAVANLPAVEVEKVEKSELPAPPAEELKLRPSKSE